MLLARALLLASTLMTVGCMLPVACPAHGGAPWHELRTPHFVLKTNVELESARGIARDFEAQRRIFTTGLFRVAASFEDPTEIILFNQQSELEGFSDPE